MSRIWMPGGAGGADVDMVTAGADDVLLGKVIVGPDGEPLTGILILDGTAADSQVLAGKTYYNTDAKVKRTGTMTNVPAYEDNKGYSFHTDSYLYLRMTNGAHITNDTNGYPTVRIPWSDKTVTPGAAGQIVTPPDNRVLRNVTVNAVSGLTADNIKKGAVVGGVAGTCPEYVIKTGTVMSSSSNLNFELADASRPVEKVGRKYIELKDFGFIPMGFSAAAAWNDFSCLDPWGESFVLYNLYNLKANTMAGKFQENWIVAPVQSANTSYTYRIIGYKQ